MFSDIVHKNTAIFEKKKRNISTLDLVCARRLSKLFTDAFVEITKLLKKHALNSD